MPSDKRFLVLFTFLKKNRDKKVMVFLSSCHSVKYHSELLNYIDLEVLDIHVRMDCAFLAKVTGHHCMNFKLFPNIFKSNNNTGPEP